MPDAVFANCRAAILRAHAVAQMYGEKALNINCMRSGLPNPAEAAWRREKGIEDLPEEEETAEAVEDSDRKQEDDDMALGAFVSLPGPRRLAGDAPAVGASELEEEQAEEGDAEAGERFQVVLVFFSAFFARLCVFSFACSLGREKRMKRICVFDESAPFTKTSSPTRTRSRRTLLC